MKNKKPSAMPHLINTRKIRELLLNQKNINKEMPSDMKIVEVTWMRIFKIWWSLAWKFTFFGLLSGALAGGIAGFIIAIMGIKIVSGGVVGGIVGGDS